MGKVRVMLPPPSEEMMSNTLLPKHPVKLAELSETRPTPFEIAPDAPARSAIAEDLGILGVRKLRFAGRIETDGKRDWRLIGRLGATVVQPCVVTLDPVATRIDIDVTRRFLAEMPEIDPEEPEVEMDEDETIEALGSVIDPAEVMLESLALNLPLYPRAKDAVLGEAVFSEPGIEPLRDEDTKPFAGLTKLRDQLGQKGDPEDQSGSS